MAANGARRRGARRSGAGLLALCAALVLLLSLAPCANAGGMRISAPSTQGRPGSMRRTREGSPRAAPSRAPRSPALAAPFHAGARGYALRFQGMASVASMDAWAVEGALARDGMTLSFWTRPETGARGGSFLQLLDEAGRDVVILDQWDLHVREADGMFYSVPCSIESGVWTHVAVVLRRGAAEVLHDGQLHCRLPLSDTAPLTARMTRASLQLGTFLLQTSTASSTASTTPSFGFHGALDGLAVWQGAPTAQELAQLAQLDGAALLGDARVLAYFDFDLAEAELDAGRGRREAGASVPNRGAGGPAMDLALGVVLRRDAQPITGWTSIQTIEAEAWRAVQDHRRQGESDLALPFNVPVLVPSSLPPSSTSNTTAPWVLQASPGEVLRVAGLPAGAVLERVGGAAAANATVTPAGELEVALLVPAAAGEEEEEGRGNVTAAVLELRLGDGSRREVHVQQLVAPRLAASMLGAAWTLPMAPGTSAVVSVAPFVESDSGDVLAAELLFAPRQGKLSDGVVYEPEYYDSWDELAHMQQYSDGADEHGITYGWDHVDPYGTGPVAYYDDGDQANRGSASGAGAAGAAGAGAGAGAAAQGAAGAASSGSSADKYVEFPAEYSSMEEVNCSLTHENGALENTCFWFVSTDCGVVDVPADADTGDGSTPWHTVASNRCGLAVTYGALEHAEQDLELRFRFRSLATGLTTPTMHATIKVLAQDWRPRVAPGQSQIVIMEDATSETTPWVSLHAADKETNSAVVLAVTKLPHAGVLMTENEWGELRLVERPYDPNEVGGAVVEQFVQRVEGASSHRAGVWPLEGPAKPSCERQFQGRCPRIVQVGRHYLINRVTPAGEVLDSGPLASLGKVQAMWIDPLTSLEMINVTMPSLWRYWPPGQQETVARCVVVDSEQQQQQQQQEQQEQQDKSRWPEQCSVEAAKDLPEVQVVTGPSQELVRSGPLPLQHFEFAGGPGLAAELASSEEHIRWGPQWAFKFDQLAAYQEHGYTQYLELSFAQAVFPLSVEIGFGGPGESASLVAVHAQDDAFPDKWRRIFSRSAQSAGPRAPALFHSRVCRPAFRSRRVRLEFDTSLDTGSVVAWPRIQHVKLVGSLSDQPAVLLSRRVKYVPGPDLIGVDDFRFVALDCGGDLTRSSAPAEVSLAVLPVNDAPRIRVARVQVDAASRRALITLRIRDPDGDSLELLLAARDAGWVTSGPCSEVELALGEPASEEDHTAAAEQLLGAVLFSGRAIRERGVCVLWTAPLACERGELTEVGAQLTLRLEEPVGTRPSGSEVLFTEVSVEVPAMPCPVSELRTLPVSIAAGVCALALGLGLAWKLRKGRSYSGIAQVLTAHEVRSVVLLLIETGDIATDILSGVNVVRSDNPAFAGIRVVFVIFVSLASLASLASLPARLRAAWDSVSHVRVHAVMPGVRMSIVARKQHTNNSAIAGASSGAHRVRANSNAVAVAASHGQPEDGTEAWLDEAEVHTLVLRHEARVRAAVFSAALLFLEDLPMFALNVLLWSRDPSVFGDFSFLVSFLFTFSLMLIKSLSLVRRQEVTRILLALKHYKLLLSAEEPTSAEAPM